MPEEPGPTDADPIDSDGPDDGEPIRLKAHTPVWPIAIAGAVAVLAVAVILIVRPDQSASPPADTTTTTATSSPAPSSVEVETPDIQQVEMPESAREEALLLMDIWAGMDPGSVEPATLPPGPTVESAGIDPATGELRLEVVGAELGTDTCQQQQEVSVVETDTAVVVFVEAKDRQAEAGIERNCDDLGFPITVPVTLETPLGDRTLLSLNRWVTGSSPRLPIAG